MLKSVTVSFAITRLPVTGRCGYDTITLERNRKQNDYAAPGPCGTRRQCCKGTEMPRNLHRSCVFLRPIWTAPHSTDIFRPAPLPLADKHNAYQIAPRMVLTIPWVSTFRSTLLRRSCTPCVDRPSQSARTWAACHYRAKWSALRT